MTQRTAALIQIQAGGRLYSAKGNFTWNLGLPKREAIIGADGTHGYKETAQVAFTEGEFTDMGNIDTRELVTMDDVTVSLQLGNGKTVVLPNAWYAGDGTGNTEESSIDVRFEAARGEEIRG